MAGLNKRVIVTVSNDLVTDQRMARICTTVTNAGYEVHLIGRKLPNSLALQSQSYKQTRWKLLFNKGPLFYLELNVRFFLFLLFTRNDLVYCVDADTALSAVMAKKFKTFQMVFDAHELFSEVPELEGRKRVKKIWQRIEKMAILSANQCITVSSSIAEHYKNLYGEKFYLVRNFPVPRPTEITHSHKPYIIYQGALNKGRGVEMLIEASKELDVEIKIAGVGDLMEELKLLVSHYQLEKKVAFLGNLSPEVLSKVTADAWIGYNLLENVGLSYYYSLSNKTFDYMQAGIPQLIPDFPEYNQLNAQYHFGLTLTLTTAAIVNAVKRLQSDNLLYKKLQSGALVASTFCQWKNEETTLLAVIGKNTIQ